MNIDCLIEFSCGILLGGLLIYLPMRAWVNDLIQSRNRWIGYYEDIRKQFYASVTGTYEQEP